MIIANHKVPGILDVNSNYSMLQLVIMVLKLNYISLICALIFMQRECCVVSLVRFGHNVMGQLCYTA